MPSKKKRNQTIPAALIHHLSGRKCTEALKHVSGRPAILKAIQLAPKHQRRVLMYVKGVDSLQPVKSITEKCLATCTNMVVCKELQLENRYPLIKHRVNQRGLGDKLHHSVFAQHVYSPCITKGLVQRE